MQSQKNAGAFMKIVLSTTLSITALCPNVYSADSDFELVCKIAGRCIADENFNLVRGTGDIQITSDPQEPNQPSPFLGQTRKRHSDTNIAQKKPRFMIITKSKSNEELRPRIHNSGSGLRMELLMCCGDYPLEVLDLIYDNIVKINRYEENLGKCFALLPRELQKSIYNLCALPAYDSLIESNKNAIKKKIPTQVILKEKSDNQHTYYTAWRHKINNGKINTQCVQVIIFKSGKYRKKYTYPFCAAFLHTIEASYLFDTRTAEVMHKNEYITLKDVFNNPLLDACIFEEPYEEWDEINPKDGKTIDRYCNDGVLDYEFKGKKYYSRKFF